jgi:hypothetical protein
MQEAPMVGIGKPFTCLDLYGMSDADNNEGQPEDRCNVCEWPVSDHPARGGSRAQWPHRRAVILGLLVGALP